MNTIDTIDRLEKLIFDNEELATVLTNSLKKPFILYKETEKIPEELITINKEMADELLITHQELAFQIVENELLENDILIVTHKNEKQIKEIVLISEKVVKLAAKIVTLNEKIVRQTEELVISDKEKADVIRELIIANKEKAKRTAELIIVNKEKTKRAAELIIANKEKTKRAAELIIANKEKTKRAAELIIANKEKTKRAAELIIANKEKTKRAAELIIANKEKERLINEYNYVRLLFETSLDQLVTIDIDGKITDANAATECATGLSRENLIGTDFSDYFTEPDKARIGFQKVFAEDTVLNYPLTIRHISNKLINVLYNANVYSNKGGEIIGAVAALRDITKLKQTEEVLKIANNELTHIINDKAKHENELIFANKELETFSYSVSHDLRTPLRHINGYIDLLLECFYDSLPEKARYYLNTIANSSRQMSTLIDDLLQFSHIERQEKRLENFDMNIIVNEVLASIKLDNQQRNIELHIAKLPQVTADKAMLLLVWTNLLNNAVKFSSTRKKTIIEINYLDENDAYVFSVHDNGVGFDMQYSHKLFGLFQRLHSNSEFEGTGIGLANVQHIILRHGGRTWAEANINKGATFYFSLPKNKKN
jgi:PAS domain S-box-containing protein